MGGYQLLADEAATLWAFDTKARREHAPNRLPGRREAIAPSWARENEGAGRRLGELFHAAHMRVTVYGPYDSGKTTLIKRSSSRVHHGPRLADISGRPETAK